jgi:hypothetical protein
VQPISRAGIPLWVLEAFLACQVGLSSTFGPAHEHSVERRFCMSGSDDRLEWFKNTYGKYAGDIAGGTDWQFLQNAAIYREPGKGDIVNYDSACGFLVSLQRR